MKTKIVKTSEIAKNPKQSLAPRDYILDEIEDEDYIDDIQREELAREAFARGGMNAYNEARGYDSYSSEPCGHHCDYDCPRCGEDY
jgi:hypothetical protein